MRHYLTIRGRAAAILLLPALAILGAAAGAQDTPNAILLVAKPGLGDPSFRETVVLVTRHRRGGVVGVVLNRPSTMRLGEAFPELPALRERPELVFRGGPVAPTTVVLVVQSTDRPARALHLLEQVYMTLDVDLLGRLAGQADAPPFRVYAGYAGWAPGQLEHEIHRGDWYVLEAEPDTIFHADPGTMWRELVKRASSRST